MDKILVNAITGQPLYDHICNALPAFMEDVPTTFDQLQQKN